VAVKSLQTLLGRRRTAEGVAADAYFRERGVPTLAVDDLYAPATVEYIRRAHPTCLFRSAFGIIHEPVLSLASRGVLSFHHGNLRRYRGIQVGFWELYHHEHEQGVTVQILKEELDAGDVVVEKTIPIRPTDSWRSLQQRAYAESTEMLYEACERLTDPDFRPVEVPQNELGVVYTPPNFRQWRPFMRSSRGEGSTGAGAAARSVLRAARPH
jgi:methionyl-tRNA formyltransferase